MKSEKIFLKIFIDFRWRGFLRIVCIIRNVFYFHVKRFWPGIYDRFS